MAVARADLAILVVNLQLGVLVTTDLARELLSLGLRSGDMAGALPAVALDLPTISMRHYSVRILGHYSLPIIDRLVPTARY